MRFIDALKKFILKAISIRDGYEPMRYSEEDLFKYMESCRPVRVTAEDGQEFEGLCWAYSALTNQEDFEIPEATLEIGSVSLLQSEITKIEFVGNEKEEVC